MLSKRPINRRHAAIVKKLIGDIDQPRQLWRAAWNAENARGRMILPLRANGIPYRGINAFSLLAEADLRGYGASIWLTPIKVLSLGGYIRRGQRGMRIVFASAGRRGEAFQRWYTVFNAEQIDGLPIAYYDMELPLVDPVRRIPRADVFVESTKAIIRHGGNRACYCISQDCIQMPPFETFRNAESYYATLTHELIHWTRHENRLDRNLGRKRFGDEGYALEELVAEFGSAFLMADLDLRPNVDRDHARYVRSWLKKLGGRRRALFVAAAHAAHAAKFLHALQPPRCLN